MPSANHPTAEDTLQEGGRRVIHQRGMVSALGMARGGSSRGGGDRLAYFVSQKTLSPYVAKELVDVTAAPLVFRTTSGSLAYGYEATVLADICEAILEARTAGALSKQQEHIGAITGRAAPILQTPDRPRVIDGPAVPHVTALQILERITFVVQERLLPDLTAAEANTLLLGELTHLANMAMGRAAIGDRPKPKAAP